MRDRHWTRTSWQVDSLIYWARQIFLKLKMKKRKKKRTKSKKKLKRKPQRKKKLSTMLREAEACMPTASAFVPVRHDILFAEGGHLLTAKVRNRLALAGSVLQGIKGGEELFGDDVPVSNEIAYNELPEEILKRLEQKGVPVFGDRPYLFEYDKLIAPYLPRRLRINVFFNALIELMANEWKINHARKLFKGFGFDEWADNQLSPSFHELMNQFVAESGVEPVDSDIKLKTFRGLWLASECIIRIRAQWDKLISEFIFKAFWDKRNPPKKFNTKIERLQDLLTHEYIENDYQKECIRALIRLAKQTDRLKSWRDSDMHQFSETVFGVMENPKTDQSLGTLWNMALEEHNRVREAVVAAIGIVILGPQISFTYYAKKWNPPKKYIDFDDEDDKSHHAKLADAVKHIQEVQQRLRNLPQSSSSSQSQLKEFAETDVVIDGLMQKLFDIS